MPVSSRWNRRGRAAVKRVAIGLDRFVGPPLRRLGIDTKGAYEMAYWRSRRMEEGALRNDFYEAMFTRRIGLDRSFYAGKRVLDVGCGPRGSLEWATEAADRVGVDSLVDRYRSLGIDAHAMRYVASGAESMPFEDGAFDVVTTFNALDHVVDARRAVAEMQRVVAPAGTLVIVVDIHRRPTVAEPHALPWELRSWLTDDFEVVDERHLEKPDDRNALARPVAFDHADPAERYGVLVLRAERRR